MTTRRRIGPWVLSFLVVAVLAATIYAMVRKPAIPVDLGRVERGPLAVTIDDEAETRARDVYVVSAPVAGRLLRIELEPGDRLTAGRTVVARIVPADPALLDRRTVGEMREQIGALEDRAISARARVVQARADRDLAKVEFGRTEDVYRRGFLSKAAYDRARTARDSSSAAVIEAERAAAAAEHDLASAQRRLSAPVGGRAAGPVVPVSAPVSGWVLRVPQKSEATIQAGTPLVEIGNPDSLEIVTDLLSTDAVQIAPGAQATLDQWGGNSPIQAQVRRIEPYGFTKVSALGVEEQRVNVILDFSGPPAERAKLGHGYRGIIRIVVWSKPDVLTVPASALFRVGEDWALFAVEQGRAKLVKVRIGRSNQERAELLTSMKPGAAVIVHPGDRVVDGARVAKRATS